MPAFRRMSAGLLALLLASACGDARPDLVVSAASSLSHAFGEIEMQFEEAHPDIDVVLNFGGSSALREQILNGSPVDVFASANESNIEIVVRDVGAVDEPAVFALNSMVIAVPAGNPAGVTGLDAFGHADRRIGLCDPSVPCGEFAHRILDAVPVVPRVDSLEPDVRSLVTKLELGVLDAGIVYTTDLTAELDGILIDPEPNTSASYSIAALPGPHEQVGLDFVAFVTSTAGRAILADAGFLLP